MKVQTNGNVQLASKEKINPRKPSLHGMQKYDEVNFDEEF